MPSLLPRTLLALGVPISAHAFNADASRVALCPGNNLIHIYNLTSSPPSLEHVLSGHDRLVTGIDWAPRSNRIVSCSQDRNAYVWTLLASTNTWTPALVLLRINRAATHVRWAPSEAKFAVASSSHVVSVCHFESENDWWVSKHLRKPLKSTVLSLAWHPNSVLVATAGTDRRVRVFSAFIRGLDEKPAVVSPYGDKLPFGTLCADLDAGSWTHAAAFWSANEKELLAYTTHDSSLHVYDPSTKKTQSLRLPLLPLLTLEFAAQDTIVAAGHDGTPVVFRASSAAEQPWECVGSIELGKKPAADVAPPAPSSTTMPPCHLVPPESQRAHNGPIRTLRTTPDASHLSTSSTDGKLVIWDVEGGTRSSTDIVKALSALKV